MNDNAMTTVLIQAETIEQGDEIVGKLVEYDVPFTMLDGRGAFEFRCRADAVAVEILKNLDLVDGDDEVLVAK